MAEPPGSLFQWVVGPNLTKRMIRMQKLNPIPIPIPAGKVKSRRRVVAYVEVSDDGSNCSDISVSGPVVVAAKRKVRFDASVKKQIDAKEDGPKGKVDNKDSTKGGSCGGCAGCQSEKKAEDLKSGKKAEAKGECHGSTGAKLKMTDGHEQKTKETKQPTECDACSERKQADKVKKKDQKGEKQVANLKCENCQRIFQIAEASKKSEENNNSDYFTAQVRLHRPGNEPQRQGEQQNRDQQRDWVYQYFRGRDNSSWQRPQSNPQHRQSQSHHNNNPQYRSRNGPGIFAQQNNNQNRSAPKKPNMVKAIIQPSRGDVVIREDVIECQTDPRPNAFFDSTSGFLRVYHGPMYGNPEGRVGDMPANMPTGPYATYTGQFAGFPYYQQGGPQHPPEAPQGGNPRNQQNAQAPANNDWSGGNWQQPGRSTSGAVPGAWVNDGNEPQNDSSSQNWGNPSNENPTASGWGSSGNGQWGDNPQSNETAGYNGNDGNDGNEGDDGNGGNDDWGTSTGNDNGWNSGGDADASGDVNGDSGNTHSWNGPSQAASNNQQWGSANDRSSGDNQQWGTSSQQNRNTPAWGSSNDNSQNQSSTWDAPAGSRSWGNVDAANSTKFTGNDVQQASGRSGWGRNSGGGGNWNGQNEDNGGDNQGQSNSGGGADDRPAWERDSGAGSGTWGGGGAGGEWNSKNSAW